MWGGGVLGGMGGPEKSAGEGALETFKIRGTKSPEIELRRFPNSHSKSPVFAWCFRQCI